MTLAGCRDWIPCYSRWRHGGWYVHNVRYPNGAIGCVSRNYPDKKWRIVCDPRPFEEQPTFRTRDEAARAELLLVNDLKAKEQQEAAHLVKKVEKQAYGEWEEAVITLVEVKREVARSDAQGIVDANNFKMRQAWGRGLEAETTLELICPIDI